jgi:hypothetical protein
MAMSVAPLASFRAAAKEAPAYCWQKEYMPSNHGQSESAPIWNNDS